MTHVFSHINFSHVEAYLTCGWHPRAPQDKISFQHPFLQTQFDHHPNTASPRGFSRIHRMAQWHKGSTWRGGFWKRGCFSLFWHLILVLPKTTGYWQTVKLRSNQDNRDHWSEPPGVSCSSIHTSCNYNYTRIATTMILNNWLSWLTLIFHIWTNNNLQWIRRSLSQIWSVDNSVTQFSEQVVELHFQVNTFLWVAITTEVFRHKPRHTKQTSQQAFWYNSQLSLKCFVSRL